tara:strand:+ start:66 stop:305 length:240 start_codon:yes stop_codon:yes gene_type:complete
MVVSKSHEDDLAVRALVKFVGAPKSDRLDLALTAMTRLAAIKGLLEDKNQLEISPTVRGDLERVLSEILTAVDIVMMNR